MEKRSFGRRLGNKAAAIVAAILSLCLMGTLLCQGVQKAQAATVGPFSEVQKCSISLNVRDGAELPSDLTYSLYKVASAVQQPGYDAYSFVVPVDNPFYEATTTEGGSTVSIKDLVDGLNSSAVTNDDYARVASIVAKVVATNQKIVPEPSDEVYPGLYLLVAYGEDTVSETGGPFIEKNGKYVSEAYTADDVYTFSPQLIALPTKAADSTTTNNSWDAGGWIYDPVITLKPQIDPRETTLTIIKTVDQVVYNNDIGNNASTFVFEIKGYADDPRVNTDQLPEFTNVASIVIDRASGCTNSALVSGIKSGLWVEVTEVYTGATYVLADEGIQYAQVVAPEGATVNFKNKYEDTGNHGGSVTNSYIHANGKWPDAPEQTLDHTDAR